VTALWIAILAVALTSFTIKATGPALLGQRQLPDWSRGAIALLAAALLSGLIVVDVLGVHWRFFSWTLVAGLAVAVGARLLRAPLLVAVLAGVLATAALRLLP
jgi:branched-subunit amino acid transport protein